MRGGATALGMSLVIAACGLEVVGVDPETVTAAPDARTTEPDPSSRGDAAPDGTIATPVDAGADANEIDSGSGCGLPLFTGTSIVAHRATSTITVDGDPKDWGCTGRVKWKGDAPGGHNQYANTSLAEGMLAWTTDGVYFMARVATKHAPQGENSEPWLNDAAELFLAKDPRGIIKDADLHLMIDWKGRTKSYDKNAVGHDPPGGVLHAAKSGANGFVVEAFIPKEVLEIPPITNGFSMPVDIQIDEPKFAEPSERPSFWLFQNPSKIDDCEEPHCNSNMWAAVQFVDP